MLANGLFVWPSIHITGSRLDFVWMLGFVALFADSFKASALANDSVAYPASKHFCSTPYLASFIPLSGSAGSFSSGWIDKLARATISTSKWCSWVWSGIAFFASSA
jgi:hypothetical protein